MSESKDSTGALRAKHGYQPTQRRAWLMWALGASAYTFAVFHRMSLSVTSLAAERHLHVGGSGLAALGAVELLVYFAMQIPSGLGADRFGPRRMLTLGTLLLAAGAFLFGVAQSELLALLGRALIGAGDACMFVNVLHLARGWFKGPKFALVVSLTAVAGGGGQLLATLPFSALVNDAGWRNSFIFVSFLTALLALVLAKFVRSGNEESSSNDASGSSAACETSLRPGQSLRLAWKQPGTKLGFWGHFSLVGSFVAFSGLWGVPYLVRAGSMTTTEAGAIVGLIIVVSVVASPFAGKYVASHQAQRGKLLLLAAISDVLAWATFVAVPAKDLPLAALVAVGTTFGLGSAASVASFDIARTSNPFKLAGTAMGTVNMAGFIWAVLAEMGIGAIIGLCNQAGLGGSTGFRVAFVVPLLLALAGAFQITRHKGACGHQGAPGRQAEPGELQVHAKDVGTFISEKDLPEGDGRPLCGSSLK